MLFIPFVSLTVVTPIHLEQNHLLSGMLSHILDSPEQGGIAKILQPYPPLNPKALFSSFDYVDKPYADFLDSAASVLILWSMSSIFLQCVHAINGRNTKSLALKDLTDQMLHMSLARIVTVRRLNMSSFKPTPFSRLRLRLFAALVILLFIGIDAFVVFCQTSRERWRGLDTLQLRRLTLRKPVDNRLVDGGIGCLLLVSRDALNDDIPLYYCTETYPFKTPTNIPRGKVEIYYGIYDNRFFRVSFPRKNDYAAYQISVQLRDKHNSGKHYVNLSAWGFKMSKLQIKWIADILNENCPRCEVESLDHEANVAKISANSKFWSINNTKSAFQLGFTMIELSNELIQSVDFTVSKNGSEHISSTIFTNTTSGSVKRVSGILLWIFAGILELIRILSAYVVWDIDEKLNQMIAAVLDLPPTDLLGFSPSMAFDIVGLDELEQESKTDQNDNPVLSNRFALRRKG